MSSYTSNSRRRVVLITTLVAVVIGQAGRLPVPRTYWHSTERVYRTARERSRTEARQADVLLLGDSRIEFGLQPQVMAEYLRLPGMKGRRPEVVNLGVFGGIPPAALWLWWQATRSRTGAEPKLLVLGAADLDMTARSPGRDYALRYLYDASDAVWLARSGQYDDAAALLTFRTFPLYARRITFENWVTGHKQALFAARREGPGGWWLPMYYDWYRDYRINPFQKRCLEQLIDEATRRGTRVVLVAPPVEVGLLRLSAGGPPPPGMETRAGARLWLDRKRAPLPVFEAAMADIVSRTHTPYFDYLTPQESVRFTYDASSHLSPQSATEFSRELAERINQMLAAHGEPQPGGPS
jgi:hypothetical protein